MLFIEKVKISIKYLDFLDIFYSKKALMLLELTKFNYYTIQIYDNKPLFYRLIYSLGQVKLKILKIYIKINQINSLFNPQNFLLMFFF